MIIVAAFSLHTCSWPNTLWRNFGVSPGFILMTTLFIHSFICFFIQSLSPSSWAATLSKTSENQWCWTESSRELVLQEADGSTRGNQLIRKLTLSCNMCYACLVAQSCRNPWGCPPPGDLPEPGIEPRSPMSPALQVDSLPAEPFN